MTYLIDILNYPDDDAVTGGEETVIDWGDKPFKWGGVR